MARSLRSNFNPTVDRILVVSNTGQNLRLHPDTGAVVDSNPALEGVQTDGKLIYAAGDVNFGKLPMTVSASLVWRWSLRNFLKRLAGGVATHQRGNSLSRSDLPIK